MHWLSRRADHVEFMVDYTILLSLEVRLHVQLQDTGMKFKEEIK